MHGMTSVVMGSFGVGFAPAKPDRHEWLIGLMEGVEDIPGSALAGRLLRGPQSAQGTRKLFDFQSFKVLAALCR